jgi:hypothetical protein
VSRGPARHHVRVAAFLPVAVGLLWLAFALSASAASPSPGPATGGDPRSSGQGPGLVGDPAFALLAVVGIGLATAMVTVLYVRLTNARTRG